jgi:hypothetical protein
MTQVTVEFTLSKPKGSEERITLARGDATSVLNFDDDGKATESLNADQLYFVRWYFLGAEGDELSVDWKTKSYSGSLIDPFKLDGRYARPYPGGLWIDDGTTGFVVGV